MLCNKLPPVKILLVEDEAAHALMVQRAFENQDSQTILIHHQTLNTAREALNTDDYSIIISDLKLPDGLGTELVDHEIPLIVMTSHGDEQQAVNAMKCGAWDYVVKSEHTFGDMPHIAERALREWQLTRENKAAQQREKELNRRLAHAERLKAVGTLAGGVAHDLNNIFTPLLSLPELILQDLDLHYNGDKEGLKKIRDDIHGISRCAVRAAAIVQDLLTLSRQKNYPLEILDLTNIVREFITDTKLDANIECTLGTSPLKLMGSANHIKRILLNLVHNAIDSARAKSLITIATSETFFHQRTDTLIDEIPAGRYVQLEVTDKGTGITDVDINKIFEPFYTTKPEAKQSGTGLGLSIVLGIIRDHDGYANVITSVKGTKFIFYFPSI